MWQGANRKEGEKTLKRELLQKNYQSLNLSVHNELRGHFVNGQSPKTNYEVDPNTMYHNHTFRSFMYMTLSDKHVGFEMNVFGFWVCLRSQDELQLSDSVIGYLRLKNTLNHF